MLLLVFRVACLESQGRYGNEFGRGRDVLVVSKKKGRSVKGGLGADVEGPM